MCVDGLENPKSWHKSTSIVLFPDHDIAIISPAGTCNSFRANNLHVHIRRFGKRRGRDWNFRSTHRAMTAGNNRQW